MNDVLDAVLVNPQGLNYTFNPNDVEMGLPGCLFHQFLLLFLYLNLSQWLCLSVSETSHWTIKSFFNFKKCFTFINKKYWPPHRFTNSKLFQPEVAETVLHWFIVNE